PGRVVAGLPVRLPSLDIHTIGAGGGSIARLDPGGALTVGPDSAGAEPGPACYGRGGPPPSAPCRRRSPRSRAPTGPALSARPTATAARRRAPTGPALPAWPTATAARRRAPTGPALPARPTATAARRRTWRPGWWPLSTPPWSRPCGR